MGDPSHHYPHQNSDYDRIQDHERHRSTTDFKSIIDKSYKAYKSLINKWRSDHKRSPKKNQDDHKSTDDDSDKIPNRKLKKEKSKKSETPSKRYQQDTLNTDDTIFSCQFSRLSRSLSRKSHPPTHGPTLSKSSSRSSSNPLKSSLLRTFSRTGRIEDEMTQLKQENQPKRSSSLGRASTISRSTSRKDTSETEKPKLSRSTSRRSITPLVFSQSIARRKPQPIEKTLECTLEELCFSAVKKINIVKDVISEEGYETPFHFLGICNIHETQTRSMNLFTQPSIQNADRIIVSQEDTLTINIKPGWTNGTKVTFEGKGDEKPGYLPADIVFSIQEKRHHLFKRTGNDLEVVVEIPLVKALTGCHLAVPLLGGETMSIYVGDIIYPGYEKVIQGQGMPNAKGGGRGDLRITFHIKFPTSLTNEQRSEACSILEGLEDCST